MYDATTTPTTVAHHHQRNINMAKLRWVILVLPMLAGVSLRQVMTEFSPQAAKTIYSTATADISTIADNNGITSIPGIPATDSNITIIRPIEIPTKEKGANSTVPNSDTQRRNRNVYSSAEVSRSDVTYVDTDAAESATADIPLSSPSDHSSIHSQRNHHNITGNLLLYWVDGLPQRGKKDLFVYYKSVAHAIDDHPNVDSCNQPSLKECYQLDAFHQRRQEGGGVDHPANSTTATNVTTIPSTPLFVLFPHSLTSVPGKLNRSIRTIRKKLATLKEEQHRQFGRSRPVYALLMVNKVYKDFNAKVLPFLDAFDDGDDLDDANDKDISRVNITSVVDGAMVMTWSPHATEWKQQYGIPFVFIPFGVDLASFSVGSEGDVGSTGNEDKRKVVAPSYDERECDVFVNWDNNPGKYSFRLELDEILWKNANDTNGNHLYYNSTTGLTIYHPDHFLSETEYIDAMTNCKMVVSTIGMPGRFDLVGTRYYEVLSLGASLLIVERADNDKELGLRNGGLQEVPRNTTLSSHLAYSQTLSELIKENETVAMFNSVDEFLQTAVYYKTHVEGALRMIKTGKERVQKHSWDDRANQLVTSLQDFHVSRTMKAKLTPAVPSAVAT